MATNIQTIPITVIGGYLGAGKTTLLNSLLRRADGVRIGVVVNDFGELGIDAGLIADARGDRNDPGVINLANGCICCTLGDDLGAALTALAAAEPRLDQIVVEASGVADPAAVAAWGSVPPFSSGGVVVLAAADTIRAQSRDRYVGGEVVRQLAAADIVVVTKTDRCDDDRLSAVMEWLAGIVNAPILEAVHGDVPLSVLSSRIVTPSTVDEFQGRADRATGHPDSLATAYVTWSHESMASVDADDVRAFLAALPAGVLRLKGHAGAAPALAVNVVGRRVDASPSEANEDGVRLEAIGVRGVLDISALDRLAATHLTVDRG